MADNPVVSAVKCGASYDVPAVVRRGVADALELLRLQPGFIRAGDKVVLKPNWVKEHDERHPSQGHWEHVVTHPAVIEGVASWVAERLGGSGQITICDAPQTDSSFAKIREYCRLDEMILRLRQAHPRPRGPSHRRAGHSTLGGVKPSATVSLLFV